MPETQMLHQSKYIFYIYIVCFVIPQVKQNNCCFPRLNTLIQTENYRDVSKANRGVTGKRRTSNREAATICSVNHVSWRKLHASHLNESTGVTFKKTSVQTKLTLSSSMKTTRHKRGSDTETVFLPPMKKCSNLS